MRLITKPEELVVGREYWWRDKGSTGLIPFYSRFAKNENAVELLHGFHVIECPTPTAADFDKLIKEQG